MKSKALLRAFLAGFIFAFSLFSSTGIGQVRFRDFREDRPRFEHYAERAKAAKDEAELESLLGGAHAFLSAQWERDAEWKISEAMRKEGVGEEVLREKSVARAEWEADLEAEEAKVRGSWLARREALVRLDFDRALLEESLLAAKVSAEGLAGKEKLARWDLSLAPNISELDARWEEKLSQTLSAIRARGDALDAAAKDAFEKEVREIEREIRAKFRLEKNSLVYRERNKIIRDELLDLKSLRASSERSKASAIADEILAQTVDALEKRKHALLADVHAEEGASFADFSNLGENWEARLRELVEAGLLAWKNAQQEFISRMASWKQDAEKAFSDGDDEWRKAYEKLARAQESWQKDLQSEINKGIEEWKKRDQELAKKLERAKQDLDSYLATTDASWEEYSKGAYQMLLQGASIHGEALGNIEWLEKMVKQYGAGGSLEVPSLSDYWNNLYVWLANGNEYARRMQVLQKKLTAEGLWKEGWTSATATLVSSIFDNSSDCLVETYEVTGYRCDYGGGGWLSFPVYVPLEKFVWENRISVTTPDEEKTIGVSYQIELYRWQKMRDEFSKLLSDSEKALHESTMLGDGGPGFLRNVSGGYGLNADGENDPYLMTGAEFEYELARREKDYYAKRLEIAQAVLDYALAEGPREDADATVSRKDTAEKLRNDARKLYEDRLAEVKELTDAMQRIKGIATDPNYEESIAFLAGELEKKKGALASAEEEYRRLSEALAVLENGENTDYITRQMYIAQSEYLSAEKEYQKKRDDYFSKLRIAEGVERAADFAETAAEALRAFFSARDLYDNFAAIVTGEASDENLGSWGDLIFSDEYAFLWEGRQEQYENLQAVYESFILSPGDEEAKNAFIAALQGELIARRNNFTASKLLSESLLDATFDPVEYLNTFEAVNGQKKSEIETQYANLQKRVFEAIAEAMEEAEEKSARGIIASLPDIPIYTFNGNNEEFLITQAARVWVEENLQNIDEENWQFYKANIATLQDADLRGEFFDFFDQVEGRWGEFSSARNELKALCVQKPEAFAYRDALSRAANFEEALIAHVEGVFGGRITFSDEFEGWSFEDFKTAAEKAAEYVEKALGENLPVSLAMHSLSQELESVSRELDALLYVQTHASDGDFREEHDARAQKRAVCEDVYNLGENALEYSSRYEEGGLDAAALISNMIGGYDALSADRRSFLSELENSAVSEYVSFIEGARDILRTTRLYSDGRAFLESGGTVGVDDFLATVEGDDEYKGILREFLAEYCLDTEGNFLQGDAFLSAYMYVNNAVDEALALVEEEARQAKDVASNYVIATGDILSGYQRDEYNARMLVEYHDNPTAFTSYRNYLVNMTKDDGDGKGSPGAQYSLATFNWDQPWFRSFLDVRDGDGVIGTSFYSDADEQGRMLGSMLVDASNRAAVLLKRLRNASKPQERGEEKTSEDYRAAFLQVFEGGETSKIEDILSDARSLKSARGMLSLKSLENELDVLSNSISSQQIRLGDLSKTAGTLAEVGGSKDALRARWQEAATVRNEKQKEYADLSEKLAARQRDYKNATDAYISKMNETSAAYRQFKDRQFAYEKAYAVWEYAHTPYLTDTAAKGTGSGEGELPGGDKQSLSTLNPADARERYQKAKEAFDAAEAVFLAKKEALEKQEKVEDLSKDEHYRTLREEFKTEAESHARFDRVATLVDEETKKLSMEVEFWQKQYQAAKDNQSGFVKFHYETDAEGNKNKVFDTMSPEEISKRDMILGRMAEYINTKGIDAFIECLKTENALYNEKIRYETTKIISNIYLKDVDPAGYQRVCAAYNAFDSQIRSDMEYLRNNHMNYELIDKMASSWRSWQEWLRKYHEACEELSDCGRFNYLCKRRWTGKKNYRDGRYKAFENEYKGVMGILTPYLNTLANARKNLKEKTEQLAALDCVRSADEFRTKTFARSDFALTESDRNRIYDEGTGGGDINISALRRKVLRKDIDGYAVEVRREGAVIRVLDREGKVLQTFAVTDPSILISSDASGEDTFAASSLADGAKGYLVDYVYSSREVSRVISTLSEKYRGDKRTALEQYAASSTHDNTIVLRDLEALYAQLIASAAKVGGAYENRPRRYEGYARAVEDFLTGEGNVSGRIVKALVEQKALFQKQDWDFTITTYQQKKKEWMEAVTFIRARGERDWAEGLYGVQQAWRRWRIDTREKIDEGEKKWEEAQAELAAKQKAWASETAVAGAEAAAKLVGEDIASGIRKTLETINAKLPGNITLKIDAEKIYGDAIKTLPKADIGALSQSMANVSTTFGISEIINLGLSNTMYEAFQAKVKDFESGMKVMKNLRMGEVVLSMMKSFEEQLKSANTANFDMVLTGLAANIPAPFERDTQAHQWKIRVVTDHSLVSTTYRTRRFEDYKDFINTTVKIKDIRTLQGGVIDFYNPATYNMIDADELEMYVSLQTDHLRREIDRVFTGGESSLFGAYSKAEFDRLQNEFTERYKEYMQGQAMLGMGWYSVPVAPGIPVNTLTLAKVAGSIALSSTGFPWAALAMNAAFTALEAKDGGMTWKQAALKVGIDAAITSLTWGAGQLGTMTGEALSLGKNSVEVMKAGFTAATSTALGTLGSCVQYNPDGSISWDQEKFHDNKTWSQAGLSFATSFGTQALSIGLKAGVDIGNKTYSINSNLFHTAISSTLGTLSANIKVENDGGWDWQGFGNIDGQKAVVEGVGSYAVSTATGGFKNEYMQAFAGALIGAYVKKGVSELFEHYTGSDFKDAYSLDRPIRVDTLSISTRQTMDWMVNYFANGGKNTMTVKEKVPKYEKRKFVVWDKSTAGNKSAGGGVFDGIVSNANLPIPKVVEKTVQVGYEEQTKTIVFEDRRTFGEKLLDGFADAFSDLGTIGASFELEWKNIKNDFGNIGLGIGAGFMYAYEGAKNLVSGAIEGLKKLFGSSDPALANKATSATQKATFNELQEKGRQEWSKKANLNLQKKKELDVQIIEQTIFSKKACVFYSRLMVIGEKTGNQIDPDKALENGIKSGSVKSGYFVQDANKLASENGLKGEVLHPTIYGTNEKMAIAMLEQLEKGNPVMVLIGDSKGNFNHMEVAKGYDFDNNGNLRILLADPGFQDDEYLDVKTMQPYRIEKGIPQWSGIYNDYNILIENRRTVYGINYYEKVKK